MKTASYFVTLMILGAITTAAPAQVKNVKPVTQAMLLNPPAEDWLMYSRTYDARRYSPLKEITKQNVSRLTQVWKKELLPGTIEIIPIVHDGVMYVEVPAQQNGMPKTAVQAIDATNGNLIWEYIRPTGGAARPKTLGIFEDIIIFAPPENYIVGLVEAPVKVGWETRSTGALTSEIISLAKKLIPGA